MAKKFISQFPAEEIDARLAAVSEKVGYTFFNSSDGNTLYSFASENTYNQWVEEGMNSNSSLIIDKTPFSFEGTMRRLTIVNLLTTQNPYFTTNKKSAILRFGYVSQYKGITEPDWQDFDENAKVTIEVDKGFTGEFVKVVDGQQLLNGKNFEIDVYQHIAIGDNKVRVTIVGETTATKGTLTYTVALTSMFMLPSASGVNWHQVLVEGNSFSLGTFNIGGTVSKTVKVRVSYTNPSGNITNTDYEKNIGTNIYINTSYAFPIDLVNNYPKDEFGNPVTGVCKAEVWVEAGSASSDHLVYYLMFVAKSNTSTAKLACINEVQTIKNGATGKLFSFAVYDGTSGSTEAVVMIGYDNNNIWQNTLSVDTQTKKEFELEVQQDSEVAMFELNASVNVVGGEAMFANIPVDNSANYPAVAGYTFYFNASNRSNGESDKNILNEANKTRVPSVWDNISWVDGLDGYTTDEDGRKGLKIPAKCLGTINTYPFVQLGAQGVTIEIQYKISNSADTDEPVITISDVRDKESFLANTFKGLVITSNKVVVNMVNSTNNIDGQSYNTNDNEIVHLVLTIVPNYKGYKGNLAQLYINSGKKITFEYLTGDFSLPTAKLILGSTSADTILYKMRVYPLGFTWDGAFKNYVNTYPVYEEKSLIYNDVMNIITETYDLDYEKCKKAGLNLMVIEMLTEDGKIPSNVNSVEEGDSNLFVKINNAIEGEYDSDFEQFFNIGSAEDYWIEDELCEGQGTTAMDYARWNFRWKMGSAHGKRRITAKKNVASAMQSHKIGATRMFNDVFKWLVANNRHLASGAIRMSIGDKDVAAKRLAVYQYPVFGFQKSRDEEGNDVYAPIGLYTIGPDKGDKKTFGFNNDEYLIHLEGADHDLASVGFDYPWSKMDFDNEILGGVGKNGIIGAWEVGAAHGLDVAKDDENYDRQAVKDVLESEWKPAYEVAYLNNPYVLGVTSEEFALMQSKPSEFRGKVVASGEYKGLSYSNFEIYQHGKYDLYHYDVQYETYQPLGVNVISGLEISTDGKSDAEIETEIRIKRRERFKTQAGNYWNVWDAIYHYTFMQWLGATDNFMKNTYPYKFYNFADGGRWRWRQDDLDTIADVNNRGAAVKKYSILVGDRKDGSSIYVGDNSVFWTLIRECYPSEVKEMGKNILDALASISGSNATDKIQAVLDYFDKRWFAYAQNYFGIAGYNEDTEWTYEDVWGMKKDGNSYQKADPLLQALGSHYEAEYRWFYLRTIFFASLVGFGDFADYTQKYTGQLSYRAGGGHTFNLVPAIDFAPMCILGANNNFVTDYKRKQVGEEVTLTYDYLQDTEVYLKGAHYISDLGDLSTLKTGANSGEMIFTTRMLKNIKIGDEDASKVTTNVSKLTLTECPSLEVIDARNAKTIGGNIDLANSPRIVEALLEGTSVTSVSLPNGAKIETLHLPDTITNLSFVRLPKLGDGLSISSYANLSSVRLEENARLDDFELLKSAYNNSDKLAYVRVIGFDNQGTATDVTMLKNLASEVTESGLYKYHGLTAEGEPMSQEMATDAKRQFAPVIQGKLTLSTPVYKSELEEVENLYNAESLQIESDKYYIEFEDSEVKRIILEAGIGDGYGVMQKGTQYVDADEVDLQFKGDNNFTGIFQRANITKFNELQYFTLLNSHAYNLDRTFYGNTTIEEVTLPRLGQKFIPSAMFRGTTNLKSVHCQEGQKITLVQSRGFQDSGIHSFDFDLSEATELGTSAFENCDNLEVPIIINSSTIVGGERTFYSSGITSFVAPNLTYWQYTSHLTNCINLTHIEVPNLLTIPSSFCSGNSNLKSVILSERVQTIDSYAFRNCFSEDSNVVLTFTNLQTLGSSAFSGSKLRKISISNAANIAGDSVWSGCKMLTEVIMPNVKTIKNYTFENCTSLVTLDLSSLEEMGMRTFGACSLLKHIDLPNIKKIGSNSFSNSGVQEVWMPNVEIINTAAFYGTKLSGEYNLSHLITIGSEAFRQSEIKSMTTDLVTSIGDSAFRNSKMTVYTQLSDTPLEIGNYAFSECFDLQSVNIKKLHKAGVRAFSSCSSLQYVNFEETEEMLGNAIMSCPSLNMDVIAPKLHTMDINFNDGTPITKFIAPNLRGTIVQLSLRSCNNMTDFVVGNVTTFESNTVRYCTKLQRIVIYLEEIPQSLGSTVFDATNNCPIYIPDNLVETVKTLTGWSDHASRIKSFSEGNIPTDKEELLAQYAQQ